MINCKVRVIHERSNIIPIKKNIFKFKKESNGECVTYDLKQNCFDPSKSSPPNDFMSKLHQRMTLYESESLRINDFSLDKA
jgi:hypothetical protein